MNLNDKNIDQIFRDAAQNSTAPRYDRAFWKEMHSTLNANDKRKRGFLMWSLAGSFVSVLLIASLFLFNSKSSNLSFTNTNSQSSDLRYDDSKKSAITPTLNSKQKSSSDQGLELSKNSMEISEDNSIKTPNNQRNTSLKFNSNVKKSGRKVKKSPINPNKQSFAITSTSLKKNSQKDFDKISEKESDLSNQNIYLTQVNTLSAKNIELQEYQIQKELKPFSINKRKSINYYAKLSAGLMENYETSRPFQSGVFDISLNIEYRKEQVLFRTGLGFQMTSNADLVVSERAKVYGFGVTTHQNNLSYQSLYDIYVPFEVGYNLNNTSFGFGTQVNFLVNTSMDFESLENNMVVDKVNLTGLNDGLNSVTAQGFVWLEQSISKRLAAGIKVGTHLNSRIKEGKYFNESATTNPLYGQIILKYTFSK